MAGGGVVIANILPYVQLYFGSNQVLMGEKLDFPNLTRGVNSNNNLLRVGAISIKEKFLLKNCKINIKVSHASANLPRRPPAFAIWTLNLQRIPSSKQTP